MGRMQGGTDDGMGDAAEDGHAQRWYRRIGGLLVL